MEPLLIYRGRTIAPVLFRDYCGHHTYIVVLSVMRYNYKDIILDCVSLKVTQQAQPYSANLQVIVKP